MTRLSVPSSVELFSMLMTPGAVASMSVFITADGGGFGRLREPTERLDDLLLRPPVLTSRSWSGIMLSLEPLKYVNRKRHA
jgi:hypothetical protein